jgi:RNA polymerase sigma factor (sigma-70 family)
MASGMTGVAELTDDLIAAAADGVTGARERVLALLEPRIRLMIAARLSPTPAQLQELDDIVQETLVVLVEQFGELWNRTRDGLNAWVSGTVSRLVAARIRRRSGDAPKTENAASLDSLTGSLSAAGPLWQLLSASGTTPSGAAERAELVQRLLAALGRLKPEHRTAITLRIFDDLKIATVAEHMGISPAAASMLVVRGLKVLRRAMLGIATDEYEENGQDSAGHPG